MSVLFGAATIACSKERQDASQEHAGGASSAGSGAAPTAGSGGASQGGPGGAPTTGSGAASMGGSGGISSSTGGAPPRGGRLEAALVVEGFPHDSFAYVLGGTTTAVVVLHGGGGRNDNIAAALGVNENDGPPSMDSVPWDWLEELGLTLIFPQGRSLPDAPHAFTWNNRVMDSGEDDVAFLSALSSQVRADYGVTTLLLLGHSMGGAMVNRLWCESPGTFDGYVSIAGPASHYYQTPSTCSPQPTPPYYGLVGDEDQVLQVTDQNFAAPLWEIAPRVVLSGEAAFVDPVLLGEFDHQALRVERACNETLGDGVPQGARTIWSSCGEKMRLERVRGGGHPISELESAGSFHILEAVRDFANQLK